jgi:hypothetical protein
MNERIKQFTNLAREQTQVGTSFEQGLLAYSEKFAELIVGECIRLCDDGNGSIYPEDLVQHFGVVQ